MLDGLHVHGFVDHAVDLAVTAERQPADAIFSFPILRFRAYFSEEFPFGAEQLDAFEVEEQEEFVHPDSEHFGEHEMPELMDNDKNRKRKDHLQYFHENDHITTSPSFLSWHLPFAELQR